MSAARIAVFGDVGGHADRLCDALDALGADTAAGTLPDGLTVVSVGDLIHKGPDSDGVVALVERFRRSGAAWVQLLGNHEAHHLGGPRFWGVQITEATAATLRRWYRSGWAGTAAAVRDTDGEGWLLSHAGLCRGTWEDLGAPAEPEDAASALNAMVLADPEAAFRPGFMLGGHRVDHRAGVCWAESVREVTASWVGTPTPFHQVHGHSSPYWWFRSTWRDPRLPDVVDAAHVDTTLRRTTLRIGGHRIVGIDPGFGAEAHRPLAPFVLGGAVTTAPKETP